MMQFKDDQGKPLGVMPDTLLVGPDNYFTAREILNSVSIVVAGATDIEKPAGNPLSGMLDLYEYDTGDDSTEADYSKRLQ